MVDIVVEERRAHRRVELPATAVLLRGGSEAARFVVQNLSASGALFTGSNQLTNGKPLLFRLDLPARKPIAVRGKIARQATIVPGLFALAIEFVHKSPETEDAIQQAVLDALEESVESEPFFKPDVEAAYSSPPSR